MSMFLTRNLLHWSSSSYDFGAHLDRSLAGADVGGKHGRVWQAGWQVAGSSARAGMIRVRMRSRRRGRRSARGARIETGGMLSRRADEKSRPPTNKSLDSLKMCGNLVFLMVGRASQVGVQGAGLLC